MSLLRRHGRRVVQVVSTVPPPLATDSQVAEPGRVSVS